MKNKLFCPGCKPVHLLFFLVYCFPVFTSCSGTGEKERIVRTGTAYPEQVADPGIPSKTTSATESGIPDESDALENLIGYWFVPHGATINMSFYRDGRFLFNDYNDVLDKDEALTGRFTLKGSTLTLLYDDRPAQEFDFSKSMKDDPEYHITKKGYYFVKGGNGTP